MSSIHTRIHHLSPYYVLEGSELETISGSCGKLEERALLWMVRTNNFTYWNLSFSLLSPSFDFPITEEWSGGHSSCFLSPLQLSHYGFPFSSRQFATWKQFYVRSAWVRGACLGQCTVTDAGTALGTLTPANKRRSPSENGY